MASAAAHHRPTRAWQAALAMAAALPAGDAIAAVPAPPSIEGRSANEVAADFKSRGFTCWIEHRRQVVELGDRTARGRATRPVLFCGRWDPGTGATCLEERFAMEVDWADPRADGDALVAQLPQRRVTRQQRTCVPSRQQPAGGASR